jgi:RND family efflux transporter MFP subunit
VNRSPKEHDEKDRRKWRKRAAVGLLCALIGLVLFYGVQRIRARLRPIPPVPRPPLAVDVVKIEPAPFVVTRRYTGSVESTRRALISAQVSARVKTIHRREGEKVHKGDLLITLDDRELKADVGRLEAEGKRIEADLHYWKLRLARDKQLLRQNAVSPQKLDESRRMVASLNASLQANQYKLAAAVAKLSYALIHAPFSGAVQRLDTEVGELAVPGKVLLDLVALSPLKAVFSVPQKDIGMIIPHMGGHLSHPGGTGSSREGGKENEKETRPTEKGMEVRLIVTSLNKTITGTIDHIYPALDKGTRNATFDVFLPADVEGPRPGMAVDALVIPARFDRAIVLPREAVRTRDRVTGVYTEKGNRAEWRPVVVGETQGRLVRIVSGLKQGEKVITTPDPRLEDGSPTAPRSRWRSAP